MIVSLIKIQTREETTRGLTSLKSAFAPERPYYCAWSDSVMKELEVGRRALYEILLNANSVGLILVKFATNDSVKFNSLLIYPPFRRQGIATAALQALIQELGSNLRFVFTQCRDQDIPAIRLVTKVGFRVVGRLKHSLENSATNIVFVYTVDPDDSLEAARIAAIDLYYVPATKTLSQA